jgi:hypothetical protein
MSDDVISSLAALAHVSPQWGTTSSKAISEIERLRRVISETLSSQSEVRAFLDKASTNAGHQRLVMEVLMWRQEATSVRAYAVSLAEQLRYWLPDPVDVAPEEMDRHQEALALLAKNLMGAEAAQAAQQQAEQHGGEQPSGPHPFVHETWPHVRACGSLEDPGVVLTFPDGAFGVYAYSGGQEMGRELWSRIERPALRYCDNCDGTGSYEGGPSILTKCEDCGGAGTVSDELRHQSCTNSDLPDGWVVKHYTSEEGATIKGPGVAQEIAGDRQDAHDLFMAIWNAALASRHQVWLDDPPVPGWYWSVWNGCTGPEAIKVVYLDRGKLPGQKFLGPFEAPPMPDLQFVAGKKELSAEEGECTCRAGFRTNLTCPVHGPDFGHAIM